MLDSSLSNTAANGGWHQVTVAMLVVGAFVVAALLIWDRIRMWERTRKIETKLLRVEKVICLFETQESRRFVMKLNATSDGQTGPRDTPEKASAGEVDTPSISPTAAAGRLENGKKSKLADSQRSEPSRKPVRQR